MAVAANASLTEFPNQPVAGKIAKGFVLTWQILLTSRMMRLVARKPGVSMAAHPSCPALPAGPGGFHSFLRMEHTHTAAPSYSDIKAVWLTTGAY